MLNILYKAFSITILHEIILIHNIYSTCSASWSGSYIKKMKTEMNQVLPILLEAVDIQNDVEDEVVDHDACQDGI